MATQNPQLRQNLAGINREFALMRTLVGSNIVSFIGMNAVMGGLSGGINDATESGRAWSSAMYQMEVSTYRLQDAIAGGLLPIIERVTPAIAKFTESLANVIEDPNPFDGDGPTSAEDYGNVAAGGGLLGLGGYLFSKRFRNLVNKGARGTFNFARSAPSAVGGVATSGAATTLGGALALTGAYSNAYLEIERLLKRGGYEIYGGSPYVGPSLGPEANAFIERQVYSTLDRIFRSESATVQGDDVSLGQPAENRTIQGLDLSPTGPRGDVYITLSGLQNEDVIRYIKTLVDNGAIEGFE